MKMLGYEIKLIIRKVIKEEVFVETPESLYGHIEAIARIQEGWIELQTDTELYAGLRKLAEEDYQNDLDEGDEVEEGESYYTFEILKTVGNIVHFRVM